MPMRSRRVLDNRATATCGAALPRTNHRSYAQHLALIYLAYDSQPVAHADLHTFDVGLGESASVG